MKTASKVEVKRVATELLEPLLADYKQSLQEITRWMQKEVLEIKAKAELDKKEILDKIAVLAFDMEDRATAEELAGLHKVTAVKDEGLARELEMQAEIIRTEVEKLQNALRNQTQRIDSTFVVLAELRQNLQKVEGMVQGLQTRISTQDGTQAEVLKRISEFEEISVRNHSAAIHKLAEGILEAVTQIAAEQACAK